MVAHPYDQIRISDIILAVDEPIKANRCQSGSPGGCQASGSRCITHDLWVELTNHIYLFLNSVSLEDVINKRLLGISGAIFQRENPAAISRSPEVEHNQDVRVVAS